MCGGPRLNCCFISVGERKTYTQSAVITLEILVVTMEAFVSLLNGLPGHSLRATDCAESIFRLFNFISCSSLGGFLAKDISGGQLLLIAVLLCHTICLLELSGHN